MEKKINISELLKDCPKGTKLYSPLCGECEFDHIEYMGKIVCQTKKDTTIWFLPTGVYFEGYSGAECVLFPSKENRDWSKFQKPFKDGDIVALDTEKGAQLFIFKEYIQDHWYIKSAKCYMMLDCGGEIDFESGSYYVERLATEEEKEKLFDAIKEHGYKWNEETKTWEEFIESNEDVDDKVVMSGIYFDREHYADEVELHLNNYEIEIRDGKTYAVLNKSQVNLKELERKLDEVLAKETTESLNKWLDEEPDTEPKAPILSNRYDYAEGKNNS